jgi:predicted amidohydrolase YtcJ
MMDPAQNPTTALAVRAGTIVATAGLDEERELLDAWRGPDSVVIDDPGLTVLPAFVDTHNHLALAARNLLGVPVSQARDIAQIVELIRQRASRSPAGQWIIGAADWHERPAIPPGWCRTRHSRSRSRSCRRYPTRPWSQPSTRHRGNTPRTD